jgi:hypothetical protein
MDATAEGLNAMKQIWDFSPIIVLFVFLAVIFFISIIPFLNEV